MNIILPGAVNPDPTQWTYLLRGGPLDGSKVPINPAVVRAGTEVGLDIGGKMACYRQVIKNVTAGTIIEYYYVS